MKALPRWLTLLARIAVAGVFIYAGAAKAPWPQRFAIDIESYQLVSPAVAAAMAFYLPYLEILGGVGLFLNRVANGAALLLTALTTAFLGALVSAWARGLEIRCGCFGAGEASAAEYPWWIGRDLLLLAGCVLVWISYRPANAHDDAHQRP